MSNHSTLVLATPPIPPKNETLCPNPFGARQPLQVYATQPSPQVRNREGKAQYERDDVQEGEEAGNPNAKKAGMTPSLLQNDRWLQNCLGPAHGMHTVMTPDPMTWGDPSEVAGYIQSTTKPSPFEGW